MRGGNSIIFLYFLLYYIPRWWPELRSFSIFEASLFPYTCSFIWAAYSNSFDALFLRSASVLRFYFFRWSYERFSVDTPQSRAVWVTWVLWYLAKNNSLLENIEFVPYLCPFTLELRPHSRKSLLLIFFIAFRKFVNIYEKIFNKI